MRSKQMQTEELIDKIMSLPPEKIVEVEDFVEFLRTRSTFHKQGNSERANQLREVADSMRANTFSGCPPHFTREELHERG
jgi:hypothetical protein